MCIFIVFPLRAQHAPSSPNANEQGITIQMNIHCYRIVIERPSYSYNFFYSVSDNLIWVKGVE